MGIMNKGLHKLYLNTGKEVVFLADPDNETTLIYTRPMHQRQYKDGLQHIIGLFETAWNVVGVRTIKRIGKLFGNLSWVHPDFDDLTFKFVSFRWREVVYDEVDGETQMLYYVRLSRSVDDIPGAKFEGVISDEFVDAVCSGLWQHGLQGSTPLASYSPTGQMCVSFGFYAVGKRVLVSNRFYRDV